MRRSSSNASLSGPLSPTGGPRLGMSRISSRPRIQSSTHLPTLAEAADTPPHSPADLEWSPIDNLDISTPHRPAALAAAAS